MSFIRTTFLTLTASVLLAATPLAFAAPADTSTPPGATTPATAAPAGPPPMCRSLPKPPMLTCDKGQKKVCAKYAPCNAGTIKRPNMTRRCVELKCVSSKP